MSAEIRPPTIKGLMRFWWRAITGLDLNVLKNGNKGQESEGEIFGASDNKIGRSKFTLRVINEKKVEKKSFNPLMHKSVNFSFKGVCPGQKFTIYLSSCDSLIERYSRILEATLILGGMGKRSRRGFGAVEILKINNKPYDAKYYTLEGILEVINSISNNDFVKKADRITLKSSRGGFNPRKLTKPYPYLKEVQIASTPLHSWEKAIIKIGNATHKNARIDSLGYIKKRKRFASPIYVSIIKKSEEEFFPIISTLETVFENKGKIDYKKQNEFKEEIIY